VFRYTTRIGPIEAGSGPVHVFVPLARESPVQRVLAESLEATIPGRIETEPAYGNRFWHGTLEAADGAVIEVTVETGVERRVQRVLPPPTGSNGLSEAERAGFERFLAANERVVVGHEMLDPILAEIAVAAGAGDAATRARATYDWVVDNVEYKKVGTGWGNGDTFWACTERYGNCTDFHALFISLARTQGIPARFEIGFPLPEDRPAGEIGGYHCWVEFYLPETGWFPIDASEAFKHPSQRDHFYGTHPTDRIHFTTGRDLRLGVDHADRPLNYFIHPYVEVGGIAYTGPVERSFSYRPPADRTAGVR
jgi:transglutaminase-like putative cysteine protease